MPRKSNVEKLHILPYCTSCGARGTEAHPKYSNKCLGCGQRYSRYANYRAREKAGTMTAKLDAAFVDLKEEYILLAKQGWHVPMEFAKYLPK